MSGGCVNGGHGLLLSSPLGGNSCVEYTAAC